MGGQSSHPRNELRGHGGGASNWSTSICGSLPMRSGGPTRGGTKAIAVIGTMLAGGDSVADVDVLRAGAGGERFDQGRARPESGCGSHRRLRLYDRCVFGTAKHRARFGSIKVRGHHPLLATLAGTGTPSGAQEHEQPDAVPQQEGDRWNCGQRDRETQQRHRVRAAPLMQPPSG